MPVGFEPGVVVSFVLIIARGLCQALVPLPSSRGPWEYRVHSYDKNDGEGGSKLWDRTVTMDCAILF